MSDNDKSSKSVITKIITDEPTEDDVLDFKNYSQKLADIIENSTPRFAIGVFGGWGTGKTSLMKMTKRILDPNPRIVTVWFDAWRYEREQNLAVIPFLRTIKLTLDASEKSKEGKKWEGVKNGIKRSAAAFLTSTKITYGVKDVVSAETDFAKVADSLKGDGSIGGDRDNIYYYVTQFLEKALKDLLEDDPSYRIVLFIDDLDRCSPDRALEVLESIKSFFDIEGFVYVIGMDSATINSLVKKKYGEESAVKGLDYLQKIVQLPFHIPTWKEVDISSSIGKIISKGLEGSKLAEQFENNKSLIVKAVELNPRQVKRFINNIILAKSVFGKPIDELIAVQALNFRQEWSKFLDLITPNDEKRKTFFSEYKKIKEEGKIITTEAELDKLIEQISEKNHPLLKDVTDIFRELVRQGNSLREFLDAGAQNILEGIEKMEEHRRALDTTKLPTPIEEEQQERYSKEELIKLLHEGKVQQFNELSDMGIIPPYTDLVGANLSGAKLSGAYLVGAKLSDANLSNAYLVGAKLSDAKLSDADLSNAKLSGAYLVGAKLFHANLSHADLSNANLSNAKLSRANLSHAMLSNTRLTSSIIIGCKGLLLCLTCENADFEDAIIDDPLLTEYLTKNKAKNIPNAVVNKGELQNKLEKRGDLSNEMIEGLLASSHFTVKQDK